MDKKETYLYGVLLALSREQLEAMAKAERRQLGLWGRYRASARGDTMAKFIVKIMEHKTRDGLNDPLDPIHAIASDLSLIEQRKLPWEDIRPVEIDYVRAMIGRAFTD